MLLTQNTNCIHETLWPIRENDALLRLLRRFKSARSPLPNARAIVDAFNSGREAKCNYARHTELRGEERTADDPRGELSLAPGIREAVFTRGGRGFISMK